MEVAGGNGSVSQIVVLMGFLLVVLVIRRLIAHGAGDRVPVKLDAPCGLRRRQLFQFTPLVQLKAQKGCRPGMAFRAAKQKHLM